MNLILCHKDCKHQKDGSCQLTPTARVENATLDPCCYYQKRTPVSKNSAFLSSGAADSISPPFQE